MAVKTKREKRYMMSEEIRIRKMISHHQVRYEEIAQEMGITLPGLTYHLRSLTPTKVAELEENILGLSNQTSPQKAAS